MKLIINDNHISATATDYYNPTGYEQAVIAAPDDFDVARLHEYVFADGTIYIPAPPPEPTAEEVRRAEIDVALTTIDAASARPLRAILAATTSGDTADPADVAKLAEFEAQAKALREELATLA